MKKARVYVPYNAVQNDRRGVEHMDDMLEVSVNYRWIPTKKHWLLLMSVYIRPMTITADCSDTQLTLENKVELNFLKFVIEMTMNGSDEMLF